MMLILRSLVFNIAFYANLFVIMIIGLPCMVMKREATFVVAHLWSRSSLWLLDKICGIKVEFRGVEKIPKGGFILAPKHQSVWETFAILPFFDDFTFIIKQELTWVPMFGWYMWSSQQIAIDRSSGKNALAILNEKARKVLGEDRVVIIFPEGTRRAVGAPPLYKFGVAQIYAETGATCLPVALNAGLFWPRRGFLRRPGTVVVEFLDPIAPGLDKKQFMNILEEKIETATNRLVADAIRHNPALQA